jgi:hypothetical protein
MSYGGPRWISDYTYRGKPNTPDGGILGNINARFPPPAPFAALSSIQDKTMASSGAPKAAALSVVAIEAAIVSGSVNPVEGTSSLDPIFRFAPTVPITAPAAGTYSIQLNDADGIELASYPFEPQTPSEGDSLLFTLELPWDPATRSVVLLQDGIPLNTRVASSSAPTIRVISPNGGESFPATSLTLSWTSDDADGNILTYTIQYSPDGGTTWQTVNPEWTGTNYVFRPGELPQTALGLFRVTACDGFHCASDQSDAVFAVANNAPRVQILAPADNQTVNLVQALTLRGFGFDREDGRLTNIQWSSSIGGPLGTGIEVILAPGLLAPGNHLVTATVLDSAGTAGSASVSIVVPAPTPAALISLEPSAGTLAPAFSTGTVNYTDNVSNVTTSMTVTPTVADSNATVKVNGVAVASGTASVQISLNVGPNVIDTVVTAPDGTTTKTYKIVLTRANSPSSNADLASLVPSVGTLTPAFASGTRIYSATLLDAPVSVKVTPTVVNSGATVTVNGTAVASGAASGAIGLDFGFNVITTVVTAEDGITTKTYTITLTVPSEPIVQPSVRVPVTDGVVNAIATENGVTYFGGNFSKIGYPSGGGLVFNKTTGADVPGFPLIDGPVLTAISDGAGGFYIGGSFRKVGGIERPCLAHILANGQVDTTFNAGVALTYTILFKNQFGESVQTKTSTVNTVALDGSTLYIGGQFKTINGVERWGVAALNAQSGAVLSWNPSIEYNSPFEFGSFDIPGPVNCLLVTGSHVYVGGGFSHVNRRTSGSSGIRIRPRIARFDKVIGLADLWNPNGETLLSNGALEVRSMAISGSDLFIGGGPGNFIGGQTHPSGLAKIDVATGTVVPTWNPSIPGSQTFDTVDVGSVTVIGTRVFVGVRNGLRTLLFSVNAVNGKLDSWDPKLGATETGFRLDPGGDSVAQMIVDGPNLLVAGSFDQVNGQPKADVVALDTVSAAATSFQLSRRLDRFFVDRWQTINTIAISGGNVFVGGDFTVFDTYPRHNLAAIFTDTKQIHPWSANVAGGNPFSLDPYTTATVRTLITANNTVYVGGDFTMANLSFNSFGSPVTTDRNNLAAFDPVSGDVIGWDPNVNAPVYGMASIGPDIFAGGDFSAVNGTVPRNFLAAFNGTSGATTLWNPNADNLVRSVATDGTNIYAGGHFQTVNGSLTRRGIACFDENGTATGFDANVAVSSLNAVRALAVVGGTLYAGGDFLGANSVNGNATRNYAAAFDPATGVATAWNPDLNNTVLSIAADANSVYLAGAFDSVNGGQYVRRKLAAFDPLSGAARNFNPAKRYEFFRQGPVNVLSVVGDSLIAGGTWGTFAGFDPQTGLPGLQPADWNSAFGDSSRSVPGFASFALATTTPAIAPPIITSSLTAAGASGDSFSYQIAASGTPAIYGAKGLPDGLTIDTATGAITGTPTVTGTFNVELSATNAGNTEIVTLVLVVAPSVNADLASLVLSAGTLTPAFSSSQLSYTAGVPNTTASITVTPTTASSTAKVTVNGNTVISGSASGTISLNVGSNTITTVVTAQDNTPKTYTLTVTRFSNDANLSSLVLTMATLAPSFASGIITYASAVPNTASSLTVTPGLTHLISGISYNKYNMYKSHLI